MSHEYNDSHRLFIQSMITKRTIPETEAIELYNQVCAKTNCSADLDYQLFISNLNKELNELDFSLRISHCERTGKSQLSFVNGKQDQFTEQATPFNITEVTYIRELIDAILNEDDEKYAIRPMTALHLGQKIEPVKLNQKDAQTVLDQLVKDKWLNQTRKGAYYLDIRAIAELQPFLREQYEDLISECTICLEITTMGERCENGNCPVRLHRHCASTAFRNTAEPVCPQCSTGWLRTNIFGSGLSNDDSDDEE